MMSWKERSTWYELHFDDLHLASRSRWHYKDFLRASS